MAAENGFYNAVLKFDCEKEEIVTITSFGPSHNSGEVFYQQRDNSDASINGEDDGYLMTAVHDWRTDSS